MQSRDHLTTGGITRLHVGFVEMGAVEVQPFCRTQDNLRQESGVACAHFHSVFACSPPPKTRGEARGDTSADWAAKTLGAKRRATLGHERQGLLFLATCKTGRGW